MCQHFWSSSAYGCCYTCWTEEKLSPFISSASSLDVKIGLCWPASLGDRHLCWRSKHSWESMLSPHTVNLWMSVGLLTSSWEPKVKKNRTRNDMFRMTWIRCSPHQSVKWRLHSNALINAGSTSCACPLLLSSSGLCSHMEQSPPVLSELYPEMTCLADCTES